MFSGSAHRCSVRRGVADDGAERCPRDLLTRKPARERAPEDSTSQTPDDQSTGRAKVGVGVEEQRGGKIGGRGRPGRLRGALGSAEEEEDRPGGGDDGHVDLWAAGVGGSLVGRLVAGRRSDAAADGRLAVRTATAEPKVRPPPSDPNHRPTHS